MDLNPHLSTLRTDLAAAAAVGGEQTARAAGLLTDALEPALRLVLLDLLTEAADDLSVQLGGATVEVRLRSREPELVVSGATLAPEPDPSDGEGTARLTLRLPETLKARAEQAAGAEGVSVNAWLIRAVSAALLPTSPFGSGTSGPRRITGYGRA